ncbi:DUF3667 domain-containing protein [Pseudohongiella sp.]|uniref:DUF3667 domain-containing protein n=1 Tax=marine sediment metagenome TaxID=412755 RepID=A0A0F9YAI1_9ZZZZ|nr:DUF3667 domain-containing protein [Pseudohongiella sp.]HDZ07992.1 DUF3667 domain-containing protein [Pseudohongiella sp.]HEA64165.1 DUF3667 domain-containing protein [Pseudohongiella sp.]
MNPVSPEPTPVCLNCRTPLQGNWCHVCGQPVKGMVRDFPVIMGDLVETLFEYDNRIWRTLLQIYFRPGYVTNDFIVGRRVRYVLPFRLFFTLSLITFLMLQLVAVPQGWSGLEVSAADAQFSSYQTVEEVIIARDRAIDDLQQARAGMEQGSEQGLTVSGINLAVNVINAAAERRIVQLGGESDAADSSSVQPSPEQAPAGPILRFDGRQLWDPETTPLDIAWLPATVNQTLNQWMSQWLTQAEDNLARAGDDPGSLIEAMYNLLPVTLFVLMPIFALLLKIFYLFKRRLYMEHLVVALHSHSFLFLAIVVSIILGTLSSVTEAVPVLGFVFDFLFAISMIWFPVYLLLMQKRVYAQDWPMTLIKFTGLGVLYTVMILAVLTVAAIIGLVTL